ncbi:hypothetical protein [Moraxella lacunata]|uniref:hypothetical protein n=1 Tax=Moraxella lacunata TaxID=477 RepID=UPI003EE1A501
MILKNNHKYSDLLVFLYYTSGLLINCKTNYVKSSIHRLLIYQNFLSVACDIVAY